MKLPNSNVSFLPRLRNLGALSALLGLAAALALQPGAQASPQLSANAEAPYLGSETPAQTATSGTVSDDDTGPGDPGEARYGTNTASATFGILKASSSVGRLARSSPFPNAAFGSSTASFRDDFLVDGTGLTTVGGLSLNGTAGTLKVRFTINGTLAVDKTGTPAYTASESSTYAQAAYTFVAPGTEATKSQRLRYALSGHRTGSHFQLHLWDVVGEYLAQHHDLRSSGWRGGHLSLPNDGRSVPHRALGRFRGSARLRK